MGQTLEQGNLYGLCALLELIQFIFDSLYSWNISSQNGSMLTAFELSIMKLLEARQWLLVYIRQVDIQPLQLGMKESINKGYAMP